MSEPDGNTAAERLHNDGLETWEEKLLEEECLSIVKDMLLHDDQRAIEIFDELSDEVKASTIRTALSLLRFTAIAAIESYAKHPWIQEIAWENLKEKEK